MCVRQRQRDRETKKRERQIYKEIKREGGRERGRQTERQTDRERTRGGGGDDLTASVTEHDLGVALGESLADIWPVAHRSPT